MQTMLSLFVPQLRLDSQAIKLQCNTGQSNEYILPTTQNELLGQNAVLQLKYTQLCHYYSHRITLIMTSIKPTACALSVCIVALAMLT